MAVAITGVASCDTPAKDDNPDASDANPIHIDLDVAPGITPPAPLDAGGGAVDADTIDTAPIYGGGGTCY